MSACAAAEANLDQGAAWRKEAACLGSTEMMFDGRRTAEATATCRGCGVREVCLWETLRREAPGERYGVAGGASPGEREGLAELVPPAAVEMAYRTALVAWCIRSGGGGAAALTAVWPAVSLPPPLQSQMGEAPCIDEYVNSRGEVASVPSPAGVAADGVETVAAAFGVAASELRGRSRQRHLVEARQVAMYVLREATGLSLPAIGRALGGRDHTTVMHALERVRERLHHSPTLRERVGQVLEVVDGTRAAGEVASVPSPAGVAADGVKTARDKEAS